MLRGRLRRSRPPLVDCTQPGAAEPTRHTSSSASLPPPPVFAVLHSIVHRACRLLCRGVSCALRLSVGSLQWTPSFGAPPNTLQHPLTAASPTLWIGDLRLPASGNDARVQLPKAIPPGRGNRHFLLVAGHFLRISGVYLLYPNRYQHRSIFQYFTDFCQL